jgi:hypothetical protein
MLSVNPEVHLIVGEVQNLAAKVNEARTVWNNTAHMNTAERIYVTGGTMAATELGARQLDDAHKGADAVDGHVQSRAENVIDTIDGTTRIIAFFFMLKSGLFGGGCFAAGTPILTPDGSKPIEEFQAGDWVLTSPDDDPKAEPVPRQVEETFVNYLPLLELSVNGRTICTTAEHPVWVRDRGWVAAHQLEVGDELRTHDGRWLKVDGLDGPKPSAPVYNMCVAEYHTYFVGHQIWGFAIWSHNMGLNCPGSDGSASAASKRGRSGSGRFTEPELPDKTIVKERGVTIEHYTRRNDHPPAHAHVYGEGPDTRIGANGRPLKGDLPLSSTQKSVIAGNLSIIRRSINKIKSWWRWMYHLKDQ